MHMGVGHLRGYPSTFFGLRYRGIFLRFEGGKFKNQPAFFLVGGGDGLSNAAFYECSMGGFAPTD